MLAKSFATLSDKMLSPQDRIVSKSLSFLAHLALLYKCYQLIQYADMDQEHLIKFTFPIVAPSIVCCS